ncbi:MAG: DNA cytosine methyltransferase, partial [Simkaniaceae bacterium]|nr:DNA cytosine methyltransferase [Simkaniaceae bacterium]
MCVDALSGRRKTTRGSVLEADMSSRSPRTFIDLFCGIGGFHIALSQLGARCVFASDNNEKAMQTYRANHRAEHFAGDITAINPQDIPDHDLLCAGFPCQPFSQAGFKKGFQDARGALFANIIDIMKAKKPKAFFLENVRHLKKHDEGKTFSTIQREIEDLGYSFFSYVVYAKDHGVPQLRPRLFMIGLADMRTFSPPAKKALRLTMSDVMGGTCTRDVGYTLRVGGVGSGIRNRHNWDSYVVDGKVERLTVVKAL